MANFGVDQMFGKLTAGEGKVSADTSLVVDDILNNVALYAPAALLAITFLYTAELSKDAGVECFHPNGQGWTERLFMNNYCWESLTGYNSPMDREITVRNATDSDLQIWTDSSSTENLNYHRAFPFAILTCIFVGLLPTIFWSVIDLDRKIKIEADYLEMGIEESLQLTLRQMVGLVKNELSTEQNEMESGNKTKYRLREFIKSDPKGEGAKIGEKFESFQKYLLAKSGKKLVWRYMLKRVTAIISLLFVSWVMFIVYVRQDTSEFNCLVPFTPTNQEGRIRSNGVQRMVKCTLEGIPIRLICVKALVLINLVAILYALVEWFKEHDACKKAKLDFKEMCALSLTLDALAEASKGASDSHWYNLGYTDLDLLMYMTVRNLERENSKLWETCRFALRSARASQLNRRKAAISTEGVEMMPKGSQTSDDYYDHLYGIVARGLDADEEAEKIATQALGD